MPYRIIIDREKCIGAGTCVTEAPATFQLDEDEKAVVIDEDGDPDQAVLWAGQGCPVAAITLIDVETGARRCPTDD
ncbi:MAG: ferredoxin [bacterium]|nr:ferredoxin [Myxococcales bacterium]MCB9542996.1 ferredoxin [Myxococcales bacterium]MCB9551787.1 ferredoxin [Myxococcales bacterium]